MAVDEMCEYFQLVSTKHFRLFFPLLTKLVVVAVLVLRLVKAGEIALVEVVFVVVDKPRIVGVSPPVILTALGLITDVLLVMELIWCDRLKKGGNALRGQFFGFSNSCKL